VEVLKEEINYIFWTHTWTRLTGNCKNLQNKLKLWDVNDLSLRNIENLNLK